MASAPPDLSPAQHLAVAGAFLAQADAQLAQRGAPTATHPGWVLTMTFYATLHAITAYVLAHHPTRVRAHRDREEWFHTYPELSSDRFPYRALKTRSERFRYYAESYSWDEAAKTVALARPLITKWSELARKALGL